MVARGWRRKKWGVIALQVGASAREDEKVLEAKSDDGQTTGLCLMPLDCTLKSYVYFITILKRERMQIEVSAGTISARAGRKESRGRGRTKGPPSRGDSGLEKPGALFKT